MIDRDEALSLIEIHMDKWPEGSFLAELNRNEAADLLACGAERRYRPGETPIRQHDPGDSVLLVLDGVAKVYTEPEATCPGKRRRVLYAVRASGDIVGEMAYPSVGQRSATVEVARREACVVRVPYPRLTALAARLPNIQTQIIGSVSDKMRAQMRRRDEIRSCPPAVRLARVLVELVERLGEQTAAGWTLDIDLTQEDLGSCIDVSRNGVNRYLGKLQDEGVLEQRRKKITVFDMAALRRHAEP